MPAKEKRVKHMPLAGNVSALIRATREPLSVRCSPLLVTYHPNSRMHGNPPFPSILAVLLFCLCAWSHKREPHIAIRAGVLALWRRARRLCAGT
jgi:hypothetical protein